ncbi:glycosyltransferase family 4 protein [Serratia inhibens]|uniref:glycosyltransferase family 4 protein n=1 Tax=Serratia inhibens TaxID=2338073 RepID=UPI00025E300B|nr:glycosyltransferase family 1 protein [Serratia inhibens]ANS42048.1 Glycogen synthase [Serratia inhibens PRI-2C]
MLYVNARFLTQEMTGVQRFAEQICLALSEIRDDIVFVSPKGILRQAVADKLNVKIIGERTGHLWEQIDLPGFLRKNGSPLLLNLCSTAPIFYSNQIVTHHDITYKRYPKSFSKKFRAVYNTLVPLMLKNSLHLITVSDFSKREISNVYKYPAERISVVHNAVSDAFTQDLSPLVNSSADEKPYLLAVSSPNFHKNFHGMLEAYSLMSNKDDFSLKIIGKTAGSFLTPEFNEKILADKNIHFLGRVDDDELIKLYQHALAFVFPSFYEGFGIPPLEAQACGCPVIASNTASMPEVLGNSVLSFDPNDISQIRHAMERVVSDTALRNELKEKGQKNTERFSWDKSAKTISDLVDKLKSK